MLIIITHTNLECTKVWWAWKSFTILYYYTAFSIFYDINRQEQRPTAWYRWSPGLPDFWLPPGNMISPDSGTRSRGFHDGIHRQIDYTVFHSNYTSVPGLCRLLNFGFLIARRGQQGMLTTTLYNFGADVCHTNLAAFVKLQSEGRFLHSPHTQHRIEPCMSV